METVSGPTLDQGVRLSMFRRMQARTRRLPTGPLVIISVMVACALFADVIAPYDPLKQDLMRSFTPPFWDPEGSGANLLGTDALGRDILSRAIYGARLSLVVAVMGILFSGVIGTTVGLLAGYYGRYLDAIVMRMVDIQLSMPSFLLAVLVAAALGGASLVNVVAVITITYWAGFARVVRSQVLTVKERDFVRLAVVAGCGPVRLMTAHILPNVVNSILVLASLDTARIIILEATLSFLGLGVPADIVSWGSMLADAKKYITYAWWLAVFPGFAIMFAALGANLFGDWLRDYLDPKFRHL